MSWLHKARGDLLVLAGFALAAIVFYWPALLGGQVLLPLDNLWTIPPWSGPPGAVPHNLLIGDMLLQNYPWKLILEQALRERALPLWNPYEMGGLPYLATGQTGTLYPFVVLFLVLGPLRAYAWFCALHQFLAASLTYLFLRRVGLGRLGAAIGGLVFAFSFFLTVSYIWPMVLGAAVWLPLALWSLLGLARAAEKGTLGRSLAVDLQIGALAIALSVLGGHLEITFYAAFAAALYALFLAGAIWRGRRGAVAPGTDPTPALPVDGEGVASAHPPASPRVRGDGKGGGAFLLAAGVAVGLGVLVAAAQLAPFLDVLRTNNRAGDTTYRQVISYALPHRQVLGLLMPDWYGNPTAHSYFDLTTLQREPVGNNALGQPTDPPGTIFWGTKNYVEAGGYVGVVPIVLAILGALFSARRERWFFLGLAALALLLAFGSPLYALIYYGLPFFSQLRTPFRWLYPFGFAMAALAGMGVDWVWGSAGKESRIQNPESRREDGPAPGSRGDANGANGVRPHPVPLPEGEGTNAAARAPRIQRRPAQKTPPPFVGEGVGGGGRLVAGLFTTAIGLAGLLALALSFLARHRSVAFATRVLQGDPELQRAFASGAMLYSYEFQNLAIFFGLLALGGGVIALLGAFPPTPYPLPHAEGRGLRRGTVLDAGPGPDLTPGPPSLEGKGGRWRKAMPDSGMVPRRSPLSLGERDRVRAASSFRVFRDVLWASRSIRPVLGALLIAVVVGDLLFFGTRFASKEPGAILGQQVDLKGAIPTNLAGARVASLGDPQVLTPNLNVLLGVPSVGGYDTIIPNGYRRLWSLVEPPVDLPYNKIGILHRPESLASPILDLLSVRYVLSESSIDSPAARLVGQVGAIRVYERPSALPRAFVVGQAVWVPDEDAALKAVGAPGFQPGQVVVLQGTALAGDGGHGTASIAAYGLDQVVVQAAVDASVGQAGWLVLTDAYDPGWKATVDGVPTTIYSADGYVRAVQLPPGTHQVVFHYSPLSLRVGAYLSFLGLVVLGIVASWPVWRRFVGHYAGSAERVARNTAFPMATSFLNKGIDFGFAALMLRVLGPKSVGEYSFAVVVSGYLDIVVGFGLNALIIREVSRDRRLAGRYLANAIAVRLALCALAVPVVAGLVLVGHARLNLGDQAVVALVLLALALIPGNLNGALSALFNAWERNEVPAMVTVAINLARVALGTAALLTGMGIVGLAEVALLLNVVLLAVFVVLARRALVVALSGPVPADLPAMLSESLPLMLNNVLVTIFFKIDVLLLLPLKGSDAVGYYATAYKWIDGFLVIPSTFTFAVFPALSRLAEQRGESLRAAYDLAVRILLCLAVPIAVAVTFLAGDLILLLGGQAYYPQSALALQLLIWFLPFSYVNGLTQYALIAVKKQRWITLAFVIGASFNLLANLAFIPRYSFYASSVITVLSEVVLLVPFLLVARRSIGWPSWSGAVGKPALAGLLMALVALAGRQVEPHLALLLGLGVYVAAIWALRTFAPEEVAIARGVVGRLRGRATVAVA